MEESDGEEAEEELDLERQRQELEEERQRILNDQHIIEEVGKWGILAVLQSIIALESRNAFLSQNSKQEYFKLPIAASLLNSLFI